MKSVDCCEHCAQPDDGDMVLEDKNLFQKARLHRVCVGPYRQYHERYKREEREPFEIPRKGLVPS